MALESNSGRRYRRRDRLVTRNFAGEVEVTRNKIARLQSAFSLPKKSQSLP